MPEEEEKKKKSYVSLIVTVILIAGGIYFFFNKDKFSNKKHYITYFNDVDGLTLGSEVSIGGARVGKVSAVDLQDTGIRVTLAIKPDVKIRQGAIASLTSAGISGGKEVELAQGTSASFIPDGAVITGENEKSMLAADGKIGVSITAGKVALKTTDSILTDFSLLVSTAAIKDIRFQLNKLDRDANNASRSSKDARGTGEEFAGKIHNVNTEVAQLANDSRKWPADIADAERQARDLAKSTANIEQDFKSLQANVRKLKPLFDKANDRKTTLGKALNDKQSYHTANKQVDTANRTMQDMMAHPSAHWFAIFGKNR